MDKIDASMTEYHLDKTIEVKREVWDLMWDMEPSLKKAIIEKVGVLPTIKMRKDELGKRDGQYGLNSDETIEVKPSVESNQNVHSEINWIVSKTKSNERELPSIVAETVTAKEIRSYENDLPRTYRGIDAGEKAWVFKDESGKPTGWVVVHEQGKSAYVGFIGVSVNSEQTGYGSSIMRFLQEKYESLSLSMVPYDTAGRGYNETRERLARFYMRNGFYNTSGGGLAWSKNDANIETSSNAVTVKDAIVAQGTRYSGNSLLEAYLSKIASSPESAKLFPEKEMSLLKSWLELRKESRILESESDKYNRLLIEHEHQLNMAKYEVTETVGVEV